MVIHSADDMAPVALLKIKDASLSPKFGSDVTFSSQHEMLTKIGVKMRSSLEFCQEILMDEAIEDEQQQLGVSEELSRSVIHNLTKAGDLNMFSIGNVSSVVEDPKEATEDVFRQLEGSHLHIMNSVLFDTKQSLFRLH